MRVGLPPPPLNVSALCPTNRSYPYLHFFLPPQNLVLFPMGKTVEDSAPVQDRLRFLCCLSFPPRWELRRDLARRYAGMGVLGSAAAEFVDLEMWEEAVECYRQMQQVAYRGLATAAAGGGSCLWPCMW